MTALCAPAPTEASGLVMPICEKFIPPHQQVLTESHRPVGIKFCLAVAPDLPRVLSVSSPIGPSSDTYVKSKHGQLRGVYTCAGLVLLARRSATEAHLTKEKARPLQQLHYLRVALNVADTVRVDGIDKILLFNSVPGCTRTRSRLMICFSSFTLSFLQRRLPRTVHVSCRS